MNTNIAERIEGGWSIPCARVDGTDALADVRGESRAAVERARAGEGPQAVEALTLRGHGHAAHDDARYVPAGAPRASTRIRSSASPRGFASTASPSDELEELREAAADGGRRRPRRGRGRAVARPGDARGRRLRDADRVSQAADIGLVGLAVMGQNLVLNMDDHGFTVAVYNRTTLEGRRVPRRPGGRRRASSARTRSRSSLARLEAPASRHADGQGRRRRSTGRSRSSSPTSSRATSSSTAATRTSRTRSAAPRSSKSAGSSSSGPASRAARRARGTARRSCPAARPRPGRSSSEIFQAIAAKVDDGVPCCDWVGEDGAGHYVKMVHNGIEYGDMQLIAEAYAPAARGARARPRRARTASSPSGTAGELDSYLIEITGDIMAFRDEDGEPLVEKILDTAGQKGTGKWTAVSSLELGMPVTLVAEAVYARILSPSRTSASPRPGCLGADRVARRRPSRRVVDDVRDALYASKIVSYAQGFMLFRAAAAEYGWNLELRRDRAHVARRVHHPVGVPRDRSRRRSTAIPVSRTCCSTRTSGRRSQAAEPGWRRTVAGAVASGIPVPAYSSALAFYDGYRSSAPPGQPDPGAARLLRRAHVRAGRPPARRVLPHELDRPRRGDDVGLVFRVTMRVCSLSFSGGVRRVDLRGRRRRSGPRGRTSRSRARGSARRARRRVRGARRRLGRPTSAPWW